MRREEMADRSSTSIVVVAKAPVPGRVKTRLCPPLDLEQAATLAAAALLDTVDAVEECCRTGWTTPVLALTGDLRAAVSGSQIADRLRRAVAADLSWRTVRQRGRTFGDRLHHAHLDGGAGHATLQIGMDTPQVSGALLADAVRALWQPGVDAVLGPTVDGGWWALGLRPHVSSAFLADVVMSTPETGAMTLEALRRKQLRIEILPTLTDVDTMSDALLVADLIPDSRFSAAMQFLSSPRKVTAAIR